ncbi:cardiolipin synthase [Enterococcus sp. ALS3]|uniref:Cardiolipin synthase n=1 Tax=Enterococcus alishanensis TaxID=1303817 RepID=A0ABS6TBB9_9ENTE|nr:cardiolipin synthase [Enterococcus alishanensis]MBV7390194.1 cardiolipin synthase [Enterococcus alishanensis]
MKIRRVKKVGLLEQAILILYIVNCIIAAITIFRKPRSITTILAWLLTLFFLPVVGFLLYAFCGRGLDRTVARRFNYEKENQPREIYQMVQVDNLTVPNYNTPDQLLPAARSLIRFFDNLDKAPVSYRNNIQFFYDGTEKFEHLFEDLRAAKNNIHVEYYAFFNDKIGNRFLRILEEKADQGVEVRLIYDPWGSPKTNKAFFAKLREKGGKVTPFITSKDIIAKTRLNYHLHRKLVIIDGSIGWTGGFNVGDQYLETTKRFGYWRDTHGRIVGTGSFTLQEIFIRDWNVSVSNDADRLDYLPQYFVLPEEPIETGVAMQVVADGPDSEAQIIKDGFVRLILSAEKSVWIQSPYLVPDETMISAILIAVRSGIDVRIMVPDKPDHPFIYRATQYYANYLHQRGVKIYHYSKGFVHAKTMVIDDELATFGSTNQDIRSYELNFEVSSFIYDPKIAEEFKAVFEADIQDSVLLTDEMIANQSFWLNFKQKFSRLLSPIL